MIFTGFAAAPFERFVMPVLMEGKGLSGLEVGNAGEELVRWCNGRGEPLDARGDEIVGLEVIGA